jgi:hypothetical protein
MKTVNQYQDEAEKKLLQIAKKLLLPLADSEAPAAVCELGKRMIPLFINITTEAGFFMSGQIEQYYLTSLGKSFECGIVCGASFIEQGDVTSIEGNPGLYVQNCGMIARTTLRQHKQIDAMTLMGLYSKSLDWFKKSILPYLDLEEKDAYIDAAMQAAFYVGIILGIGAVQ